VSTGFDVAPWAVRHRLTVTTEGRDTIDFVDLTDRVSGLVREAGLNDGLVVIFTRHTTTGILINEHEPLLLEDLRRFFADLAPGERTYAHDDLGRRTVNLGPNERRNGHSHCRAALLRSSETLPVVDGALALGRWQRVFLVDFDSGQRRELTLTLLGCSGAERA
jgi:secondary thiamine-phosphate synthase enzyme